MIKKLVAFDLDGTLFQTPEPQEGKPMWEMYYDKSYPYKGWWSKPESLDLNVFDIKAFPTVLNQLNSELSNPNSYVIVLTSRLERLRPYVQKILDVNSIGIDKLDMKRSEMTKGEKILDYIKEFPDLQEINVYDDRDSDIESYESVRGQISDNIVFNIYLVNNDEISLTETRIINIINDEIKKTFL